MIQYDQVERGDILRMAKAAPDPRDGFAAGDLVRVRESWAGGVLVESRTLRTYEFETWPQPAPRISAGAWWEAQRRGQPRPTVGDHDDFGLGHDVCGFLVLFLCSIPCVLTRR